MKKCIAAVTSFTLIIFLACACQPTPEKPIVVDKGRASFATDSREDVLNVQEGERWKESFASTDKRFTVNIDAQIDAPIQGSIEINEFIPVEFSEEEIINAAEILSGGKPLYEAGSHGYFTKELIEQNLLNLSAQKASATDADEIAEFDEQIEFYKSVYAEAPSINDIFVDPVSINELISKKYLQTLMDAGAGAITQLVIKNDISDSDVRMSFQKNAHIAYSYVHEQEAPPRGVSVSYDEAQKTAIGLLHEIGIEHMALSQSYVANRYDAADTTISGFFDSEKFLECSDQCYVFYYTRMHSGMGANYVQKHNGTTAVSDDKVFRASWTQEYICIKVTDEGVASFEWVNPTEPCDSEIKKYQLMSLEEIKDIFRFYIMDPGEGTFVKNTFVNIENVKLGFMYTAKKDDDRKLILTPVWDFYGYTSRERSNGVIETSDAPPAYSFMTVNAIDGSIIDRGLMY